VEANPFTLKELLSWGRLLRGGEKRGEVPE